MIEIGPIIDDALARAHSWNRQVVDELIARIVRESEYAVDWDDEAGEEWCRFLRGDRLVGIMAIRVPFILVLKGDADLLLKFLPRVPSLALVSLDADLLRCDIGRLQNAFGGRPVSGVFDSDAFSALDLWYATI